jgi:hypothetical protein
MRIFNIPQSEYRLLKALTEIASGGVCDALVLPVEKADYPNTRKTAGWRFIWMDEIKKHEREVYKLVKAETNSIQGLISLQKSEGFYEMCVVETAPHNYGKGKIYGGVLLALVAFACKKSFEAGFDGEVAFTSKSPVVLSVRFPIT